MHSENILIILQIVGCRGKVEIAPRVAMVKEISVHGVFLSRSSEVITHYDNVLLKLFPQQRN